MKALTLTQPWASLMALQQKRIETRSWPTSHRGEVVIHAAKGFPAWAKQTCDEEPFKSALQGAAAAALPISRGLCIVRILACVPTTDPRKIAFALGHELRGWEMEFGDYSEGRFAWVTEYVRPLPEQPERRGALGLWEWN